MHCLLIAWGLCWRIAEMRLVKVNALPWQTKSASHGNGPRINTWIMDRGQMRPTQTGITWLLFGCSLCRKSVGV